MRLTGGAGGPNRDGDPPARRRPGTGPRRALMVVAALAAIGGGMALALLLTSGGGPSPSRPGRTSPAPTATGSFPPWGFNGNWFDYCYDPGAHSPVSTTAPVVATQACPAGEVRITGAQQIGLTARAGATTDRLPVAWGTVEPSPPRQAAGLAPARSYDWDRITRAYRSMLQQGIRPVILAYGAPGWARRPGWDRPGTCAVAGSNTCVYPPGRGRLADWRAFLRQLMRRYPQMRALEIWNEPNSARFFAPHPSPALYAGLLRAAHRVAVTTDFHPPLVTGGLAPISSTGAARIPPARFLRRIYELAGKGSFDGIGAHPYPSRPPWIKNMAAKLDQLRRVRDRMGDRATPLWITEIGIGGTRRSEATDSVSPARQGDVLVRMYRSIQGGDVRSFIIYTLRDIGAQGTRFEPYQVLELNLQPKPAYCVLARRLGGRHDC